MNRILRISSTALFILTPYLFYTNPAYAEGSVQESIAGLREDLELTNRELGKLRLEIEEYSRNAESLKTSLNQLKGDFKTIDKREASNNTIQLKEIKKLEHSIASEKQVIIQHVSERLEAFSQKTQQALKTLAKAVEDKPIKEPTFSNDYPKEGIAYTVKRGDTLSEIAIKNNSSTRFIMDANKIADAKHIRPGQLIFIPQKKKTD